MVWSGLKWSGVGAEWSGVEWSEVEEIMKKVLKSDEKVSSAEVSWRRACVKGKHFGTDGGDRPVR